LDGTSRCEPWSGYWGVDMIDANIRSWIWKCGLQVLNIRRMDSMQPSTATGLTSENSLTHNIGTLHIYLCHNRLGLAGDTSAFFHCFSTRKALKLKKL
jgi:hypothetical protein